MPQPLTGYRVFIASPGGLKTERDCFRSVLEEYNRTDGFRRGIAFIPVGWEKMAPTKGRGQEVINDQLRKCDYCVVVLHDRWGSPPDNGGDYTSGTEEEYAVARECLASDAHAMSDIAVLFKHLDPARLSDQGPQLHKVLEFKKKLEDSRELMFQTYETEANFAEFLRTSIAEWVWAHENPSEQTAAAVPPEPAKTGSDDEGADPLARAAALQRDNRFTEAETLLAAAAEPGNNAEADIAYAELLARTRRWRQAESSFSRGTATAAEAGDEALQARGHLGLGRLYEANGKGDRGKAIASVERAIAGYSKLGCAPELCEAWIALGVSYRNQGDAELALNAYHEAEAALSGADRPDLAAAVCLGRGEVSRDLEKLAEARQDFERAITLQADLGKEDPDAHAGLGAIFEALQEFEAAEEQFQRSLLLFSALRNWSGIADASDHLGHIFEQQDKQQDALEAYERAAEAFEVLHNLQAAADASLSQGRVANAMGDQEGARACYEQALAFVGRMQGGSTSTEMAAQIVASIDALSPKPSS